MELKLFHDDCLKAMKLMEPDSIDLCLTDPPYKLIGGGCTKQKDTWEGVYFDRNINPLVKAGTVFTHNSVVASEWMPLVFRLLKDGSHLYVMTNARNLKIMQTAAEQSGFKLLNIIVWDKKFPTPLQWYMGRVEFVLLFRKGKARYINHIGTTNLIQAIAPRGAERIHPTEKPVQLMQIFIENSTDEGQTVFDPFMGSGTTGIACLNTNRNFIGIELDDHYFQVAKDRLEAHERRE